MTYDAIILLGSQPNLKTWEFPEQIHYCAIRAAELLASNAAPVIITSGKWSTSIDTLKLHQPFRECDALAELLIKHGVDESKILREGLSQDTISNLYYLKTELLIPNNLKRLLFVVADFRVTRLKFLCERILGPEYTVDFELLKSVPSIIYNEPLTLKVHSEFLEPMKTGDHQWLADKFFTAPMYQKMAKLDIEKYKNLGIIK